MSLPNHPVYNLVKQSLCFSTIGIYIIKQPLNSQIMVCPSNFYRSSAIIILTSPSRIQSRIRLIWIQKSAVNLNTTLLSIYIIRNHITISKFMISFCLQIINHLRPFLHEQLKLFHKLTRTNQIPATSPFT